MRNRKQALSAFWSFAIFISVLACIFALLFAALTGREEKVRETKAPQETEEPAEASEEPDALIFDEEAEAGDAEEALPEDGENSSEEAE